MWFDPNAAPNWSDYLGLALGALGFVLAYHQLRKTRNSTVAAIEALDQAREQLIANQVLRLDASFQGAHDDLEHAAASNNRELAQRTLVRYGRIAKDSAVLLRSVSDHNEDLAKRMVRSSTRASKTKESVLLAESSQTVRELLLTEIKLIEGLVADVSALTMSLKNQVN
jgi:hypothetical protein